MKRSEKTSLIWLFSLLLFLSAVKSATGWKNTIPSSSLLETDQVTFHTLRNYKGAPVSNFGLSPKIDGLTFKNPWGNKIESIHHKQTECHHLQTTEFDKGTFMICNKNELIYTPGNKAPPSESLTTHNNSISTGPSNDLKTCNGIASIKSANIGFLACLSTPNTKNRISLTQTPQDSLTISAQSFIPSELNGLTAPVKVDSIIIPQTTEYNVGENYSLFAFKTTEGIKLLILSSDYKNLKGYQVIFSQNKFDKTTVTKVTKETFPKDLFYWDVKSVQGHALSAIYWIASTKLSHGEGCMILLNQCTPTKEMKFVCGDDLTIFTDLNVPADQVKVSVREGLRLPGQVDVLLTTPKLISYAPLAKSDSSKTLDLSGGKFDSLLESYWIDGFFLIFGLKDEKRVLVTCDLKSGGVISQKMVGYNTKDYPELILIMNDNIDLGIAQLYINYPKNLDLVYTLIETPTVTFITPSIQTEIKELKFNVVATKIDQTQDKAEETQITILKNFQNSPEFPNISPVTGFTNSLIYIPVNPSSFEGNFVDIKDQSTEGKIKLNIEHHAQVKIEFPLTFKDRSYEEFVPIQFSKHLFAFKNLMVQGKSKMSIFSCDKKNRQGDIACKSLIDELPSSFPDLRQVNYEFQEIVKAAQFGDIALFILKLWNSNQGERKSILSVVKISDSGITQVGTTDILFSSKADFKLAEDNDHVALFTFSAQNIGDDFKLYSSLIYLTNPVKTLNFEEVEINRHQDPLCFNNVAHLEFFIDRSQLVVSTNCKNDETQLLVLKIPKLLTPKNTVLQSIYTQKGTSDQQEFCMSGSGTLHIIDKSSQDLNKALKSLRLSSSESTKFDVFTHLLSQIGTPKSLISITCQSHSAVAHILTLTTENTLFVYNLNALNLNDSNKRIQSAFVVDGPIDKLTRVGSFPSPRNYGQVNLFYINNSDSETIGKAYKTNASSFGMSAVAKTNSELEETKTFEISNKAPQNPKKTVNFKINLVKPITKGSVKQTGKKMEIQLDLDKQQFKLNEYFQIQRSSSQLTYSQTTSKNYVWPALKSFTHGFEEVKQDFKQFVVSQSGNMMIAWNNKAKAKLYRRDWDTAKTTSTDLSKLASVNIIKVGFFTHKKIEIGFALIRETSQTTSLIFFYYAKTKGTIVEVRAEKSLPLDISFIKPIVYYETASTFYVVYKTELPPYSIEVNKYKLDLTTNTVAFLKNTMVASKDMPISDFTLVVLAGYIFIPYFVGDQPLIYTNKYNFSDSQTSETQYSLENNSLNGDSVYIDPIGVKIDCLFDELETASSLQCIIATRGYYSYLAQISFRKGFSVEQKIVNPPNFLPYYVQLYKTQLLYVGAKNPDAESMPQPTYFDTDVVAFIYDVKGAKPISPSVYLDVENLKIDLKNLETANFQLIAPRNPKGREAIIPSAASLFVTNYKEASFIKEYQISSSPYFIVDDPNQISKKESLFKLSDLDKSPIEIKFSQFAEFIEGEPESSGWLSWIVVIVIAVIIGVGSVLFYLQKRKLNDGYKRDIVEEEVSGPQDHTYLIEENA